MAWRDPFDIQLGGPVLSTPDLVPAEKDSVATGFLDNLKATEGEMLLVGNTDASGNRRRDAYRPLLDALQASGDDVFGEVSMYGRTAPGHLANPYDLPEEGAYGIVASRSQMRDEIFARIRKHRLADPKFLAGVPDTFEAFEKQSVDKAAAELQRIRRVQAGATGMGKVGGFLGGVIGSFQDPVNIWTMPFGGASKTVLGAFARSAAENMLVETLSQPFIMDNYDELGEHLTAGDAVRNILFAGGAGGLFGGTTKAIGKGFGAAADGRLAAKIYDFMPEPLRAKWASGATVDDRSLAETIRATVPEGRWTREQRDAVNVLEREADVRDASPFVPGPDGDELHAQSLTAALQAAIAVNPKPVGRASLLGSTAGISPPPVRTGPAQVPDDIVAFFKAKGLDDAKAHGIAAGIVAESGGNHRAVNPTSGAYGLGQHLGSRKDELFRRYGPNPSRTDQLENIWRELQGGDAGGRAVLAQSSASGVLDAYIRKFMRPAAGAETSGDISRGMEALGLEGAPDSAAPARADLDELGDGNLEAELAARELDDAAEASAGAFDRPERKARPILKRELFASDESWMDAQLRVWDGIDGVGGPSAREAGSDTVGQPEAPKSAEIASGESTAAFSVRPSPFPAGGFDVFDANGRRLVDRKWKPGDTPKRYKTEEAALKAAPKLVPQADPLNVGSAQLAEGIGQHRAQVMAENGGKIPAGAYYPIAEAHRLAHAIGFPSEQEFVSASLGARDWAVTGSERDGPQPGFKGAAPPPRKIVDGRTVITRQERQRLATDWETQLLAAATSPDVDLANPAMERFSDPAGAGATAQVESLRHDLRMEAAGDQGTYRLNDDGPELTLQQLLDEHDAEQAAIEAMRACLAPVRKAA